MKVITISELPGIVPEAHYDLLNYRIVDAAIGAKAMGASLGRMEPKGRTGPHAHENAEQLFVILKGVKLLGRVHPDHYKLQKPWEEKVDGNFWDFNGRTSSSRRSSRRCRARI